MGDKRRCLYCKDYFDMTEMDKIPAGWFCCHEHIAQYAADRQRKQAEKTRKRAQVERKKSKSIKRKELMTRSQWYAKLQTLVNQYVRWRDRYEGCCTCGERREDIKYDAGHFHTISARPDIRFELSQIHKQCSVKCNQYGSGMRREYEKFLISKYGHDHVSQLEKVREPLKKQFPTWHDVENEIIRFRGKLRAVGVKPSA